MWRDGAGNQLRRGGGGTFADIFTAAQNSRNGSQVDAEDARRLLRDSESLDSCSPPPPQLVASSSSSRIGNRATESDDDIVYEMRHSVSSSAIIDIGKIDDWRRSVRHPLMYKMGNSTIRFQKPLVAAIGVVFLALLVLVYVYAAGGRNSGHANFDDHYHYSPKLNNHPKSGSSSSTSKPKSTYNSTYPLSTPTMTEHGMRYRISIIADLDEASKVEGKKDQWRSYLKKGYLYYDGDATDDDKKVRIEWDEGEPTELRSTMSTGGRGMELSELIVFDGKLFTVDDRTGVVYQVEGDRVVPWQILADGPGTETKGFKSEWCAVKDETLYIGGLGKEWTTPDGEVINFNPMYVKRITHGGEPEHVNWREKYMALRRKAGIEFPGYMIHEAGAWSNVHKRWYFLPRRASKNKYNDVDDERMGTNMVLTASEDFGDIHLSRVGNTDEPSHGFSSFKFVPGTDDDVIVALKSQELKGQISTYIMVFRVKDSRILYPEAKIGNHKYEGIEFV